MSTALYIGDREGNWTALGYTVGDVTIEHDRSDEEGVTYNAAQSFSATVKLHPRTLRNVDRLFGFGFYARRQQRLHDMRTWARRRGRKK